MDDDSDSVDALTEQVRALRDPLEVLRTAYLDGLRPPLVLPLDEWAGSSMSNPTLEGGRLDLTRTPYSIEPLRELSHGSSTGKVVLCWAAQVGKTTIGLAWLDYIMTHGLGAVIHVRPKLDSVREFVRERIDPMIRAGHLRVHRSRHRGRSGTNTIRYKEFDGGFFFGCGTVSATDLSAKSAPYYWQDETDREEESAGKEGAAHTLIERRAFRFGSAAKGLQTSTPTSPRGPIWAMYQASSQGHYYVPCPHCGASQVLQWDHIHWAGQVNGTDADLDVWYECASCHGRIEEWQKAGMLRAGRWVHDHPDRQVRGYQLSTLYAPPGWGSGWRGLVRDWLIAVEEQRIGNPGPMAAYVNTYLGEPWEDVPLADVDPMDLVKRCEDWGGSDARPLVPSAATVLTMAVDTQDTWLDWEIAAWGPGHERWSIAAGQVSGSPALPGPWEDLDRIRTALYRRQDGGSMRVEVCLIDSGGHHTDAVYRYARPLQVDGVWAIKGATDTHAAMVERAPRKTGKYQSSYRLIGVHSAREEAMYRLRVVERGPGYCHFPTSRSADWFAQIAAPRRQQVKGKAGVKVWRWVKPDDGRIRCEAFDLLAYNMAAIRLWEMMGHRLGRTAPRVVTPGPAGTAPATLGSGVPRPSPRTASTETRTGPVRPYGGALHGRLHH